MCEKLSHGQACMTLKRWYPKQEKMLINDFQITRTILLINVKIFC